MASVAQSALSAVSSAGSQTGPSLSHALWGQLLHKSIPTALNSATRGASSAAHVNSTPTAPIDRNGTSVRMLLHDTQATLEKFSTRIEKLTTRVDDAKRELATAHKVFQAGHDKLINENVDLVNRCQTEIKRSLGAPAQAPKFDEALKYITTVDGRVERLDRQVEALHMLNQTQMKVLQSIQEQQIQLLTVIGPVLPLLQAVPLHIDSIKTEMKDRLQDLEGALNSFKHRPSPTKRSASTLHSPLAGSNSEYSPPRAKRRRIDESNFPGNGSGSGSRRPREADNEETPSLSSRVSPFSRAISPSHSPSGSLRHGPIRGHQPQQSHGLVFGFDSPSPSARLARSTNSDAGPQPDPASPPACNVTTRAITPSPSPSATAAPPRVHRSNTTARRPTTPSPSPRLLSPFSSPNIDHAQGLPQRPTQTRLIAAPLDTVPPASPFPLSSAGSDTVATIAPRSSPLPGTPASPRPPNTELTSPPRVLTASKAADSQIEASVFFDSSLQGFSTISKPMSLKDIRARGMDSLAYANERKRYIVLDEEEDSDSDCIF